MIARLWLRAIILLSYTLHFRTIIIRSRLRPARFLLSLTGLLMLIVVASELEAQTVPTDFEATSLNSNTPGLLQLQNTSWLSRQNYFSSDLINQPPGEYLMQAFDTATGLPNSSYLLTGAEVVLWMSQPTGATGSLFPEFKLFLNGPTGTPVCSMTGNTALVASPSEPVTLGCAASAAVPVTPADRYYLWVGFTSNATAADSTQVELSVGNVFRGRGRTQLWVSLAAIPNINGINPSTGPVGTQFTIRGFNFGSMQGASSARIGNQPLDIISWSDTAILASVPQGAAAGNVVVTNGTQSSNPLSFTVTQTPGALFGKYSHTVTSVTLTSASVLDWAHWGTSPDAPLVRKQGVLTDFSVIGTSTPTVFSDGEIEYSWTDGDVLPAVSRTKTGVSITGVGNGFHLIVPADKTPKTLLLYLGAWEAQGQITASLSDNAVPPFTDTPVDIVASNGDHHVSGTYALTFQAGQPGQTLSVDYVMAIDHGAASGLAGYVSLESAALVTPAQPAIFMTSPGDNQAFYSPSGFPADVPVAAVASQVGAPINKVSFFSDGQRLFDATTPPFAFSISGILPGDHVITASATDTNGATSYSDPKVVAAYSFTGMLSGMSGIAVPTDLSVGTSDWIHWGGSVPDRRIGVSPQISDLNTLANGSAHSYDASAVGGVNYSWSFGTPTVSQPGTATQMRMQGFKNGFSFTVPVDTTCRIVSLFIASGFGEVTLRASLSDGSGMPYVDVFSTPSAFNERNYSILFQAGSAGQTLTITGEVTRDDGFAYIALESASVEDVFAPHIDTVTPATAAPGDQITITGSNFGTPSTGSMVLLNGVAMNVISWTDSAITAVVPLVQSGPVVVSRGLANSNRLAFTVTPPLLSIALSPANPSVSVNSIQQLQLTATGLYSDGSSADLTSSATWVTSDRSVAMVLPTPGTPGTRGIVGTGNAGTATITAIFAGISGSTSVTVTPAAAPTVPNIADVSPSTATAGTQVTVTGTGFGSSQGNGSVWLGSTLGTIVTWSDTQVIAKVATGSTTGIAQIQQAGISSNTLPFNVITPIISSITPTSGLAGTPVTINGTGFGTVTGQLWLGTAPGIVSSWSDTQILATVAAGSATGTVQVLQAGVVSNAVPFAVNTPSITSITPTGGIAGSSVTIIGSGFGSPQGSGIVWIGSTPGLAVSWADTQVIATVDSNAVSGIVRIQQNGIWSNALSFKVPPSLSTAPSVNINPNVLSMVVGETRSLQALDDNGNVLAGLTWASTDPTLATLSTDDPPIITALAPGHITITAGNASADLTVYPGPALPLGTVQWSIPGDGSGVAQILPAVPSDSGVDVFALQQSGNIQAIKTDGRVAWTSNVGTDKTLLPDFQGGLVVVSHASVEKLDGANGLPTPSYNFINTPVSGSSSDQRPTRLFTDGTILTVDGDTVVGIDPQTGVPKFSVPLEDSISYITGIVAHQDPPDIGSFIIAGDGYGYLVYTSAVSDAEFPDVSNVTLEEINTRVLRVGSGGDWSKISLNDFSFRLEFNHVTEITTSTASGAPATPGTLITNADQGVFYSWDLDLNGASPAHQLTTISGSSVSTISLPVPDSFEPILQGSDGTLFGTVSLPPDLSGNPGPSFMVAIDALGHPKWTAPNLSPQYAIGNGNVIAQSSSGPSVTLDSGGNTTTQIASFGLHPSWTGQSYQADLLNAAFNLTSISMLPIGLDGSFAALSGGNHSKNSTAIQQVLTVQPHGPNDQIPPSDATLHPTYHAIELLTNSSLDSIFTRYILTFQGGRGTNNDVMDTLIDTQTGTITSVGQVLTFILHSVPALGQGPFSVRVNRLDPSTHTLVAVTQKGHPLDGWRYWRVFSVGTNDTVIETGAADRPHPGPLNYIGYYLANSQLKVWEEFLQFIKRDLNVPQGPHSQWNIVNGTRQFDLNYILQNMCLNCP
jgi:IPT/TIG domain-containing protein